MFARRIRRKFTPGTADPTWATTNTDPNRVEITVGGTASDGTYQIRIDPEDGGANIDIDFARASAESNITIADELATEGTTLIATTLNSYFSSITDDGAGVVTLVILDNAPPFRLTLTAPGSGTLTPDVSDVFPIVAKSPGRGDLYLEFVAVDSSGDPLAPGSGTVSFEVLSILDRTRPYGSGGTEVNDATRSVSTTSTTSAQALNSPVTVPAPPGRFTVRISATASLPGSAESVEVWAHEIVEG